MRVIGTQLSFCSPRDSYFVALAKCGSHFCGINCEISGTINVVNSLNLCNIIFVSFSTDVSYHYFAEQNC